MKREFSASELKEITERRKKRQSIRQIAEAMGLTYYAARCGVETAESGLNQPSNEPDKSTVEVQPQLTGEGEQLPRSTLEPLDSEDSSRVRRLVGLTNVLEIENDEILVLGGLAHSLGCRTIGELFRVEVAPWMRWVARMSIRLNTRPTPEMVDRLLLDGVRKSDAFAKLKENKKLWAVVEDYLR